MKIMALSFGVHFSLMSKCVHPPWYQGQFMQTDDKQLEILQNAGMFFCDTYAPAGRFSEADDLFNLDDLQLFFLENGYNLDALTVAALLVENGFQKRNVGSGWVWLLKRL